MNRHACPILTRRLRRFGFAVTSGAVLAGIWLLWPAPASAAVFGEDDRRPLTPAQTPIAANIGQLIDSARDRTVCTAFCVGSRTIATAAHCLSAPNDGPARPERFSFRLDLGAAPGDAPGTLRQSKLLGTVSGGAPRSFITGTRHLSVKPPIESARDWAVVRLEEPICYAGGLRLSTLSAETVAGRAEDFPVFNFAYHSDLRQSQLMTAGNCHVGEDIDDVTPTLLAREFVDAANLILHRCDTGGASSGSPLMAAGPYGPEVVGINVGTYVQSKIVMSHGNVMHRAEPAAVANTAASAAPVALALAELDSDEPIADSATLVELRALLERVMSRIRAANETYEIADLRTTILGYQRLHGLQEAGMPTRGLLARLRAELQPGAAVAGVGLKRPPIQETGSTK